MLGCDVSFVVDVLYGCVGCGYVDMMCVWVFNGCVVW